MNLTIIKSALRSITVRIFDLDLWFLSQEPWPKRTIEAVSPHGIVFFNEEENYVQLAISKLMFANSFETRRNTFEDRIWFFISDSTN